MTAAIAPPEAPVTPGAPNSALKEPTPTPGQEYQRDHPSAAHLRVVNQATAEIDCGPTPRTKIAVCGFASSSRHLIPILDPTWEVWGMNQLYRHIPRADRWFDIHWNWDTEVVPGTDYRGWMAACGIPVYMIDVMPDLPTSVRYPVQRLMTMAGDYFTSTVAFMLAAAIDQIDQHVMTRISGEGLNTPAHILQRQTELYAQYTIGLFGIDLVVEEEYFHQKPCAEFWIGLAVGRGIEVYIPPQSALCKQAYRYGYEPEPQSIIRQSELNGHHKRLTEERNRLLHELYLHDGALQVDEYWKRVVELRSRGAELTL